MQADRQFRRGTRTMRLAVLQQEIGALETEQAVQEECRAAIRRFVEEEGQARAQVQMLEGHALGQVLEAVEVDRSTCLVLQRDREYLEHQDYAAAEEDRLCIEAGRRDFERMQRTWRQRQNLSRLEALKDVMLRHESAAREELVLEAERSLLQQRLAVTEMLSGLHFDAEDKRRARKEQVKVMYQVAAEEAQRRTDEAAVRAQMSKERQQRKRPLDTLIAELADMEEALAQQKEAVCFLVCVIGEQEAQLQKMARRQPNEYEPYAEAAMLDMRAAISKAEDRLRAAVQQQALLCEERQALLHQLCRHQEADPHSP